MVILICLIGFSSAPIVAASNFDLRLPFLDEDITQLTHGYGAPNDPTHKGKDIYALDFAKSGCESYGQIVLPIASGTVEKISVGHHNGERNYGNFVLLRHSDSRLSIYAHLSEVLVSPGQIVISNQPIGKMGNSGFAVGSACDDFPGTHLHVAIYENGLAHKPEPTLGMDYTTKISPISNFSDKHWYLSNQKLAKKYENLPKFMRDTVISDVPETLENTTNFWQNLSNSVYNFFVSVDNPVFVAGERFGEALWEAAGEGNNQASAALIFSPPTIEPLNLELLNIEPETPDRELLSAEPLNLEPETFDTALGTSDVELENTEPADAAPAVPETPKDFSGTPVAVVTGYGNYGPTGPNGSAAPIEAIVPVPPACAAFTAEYFANLMLAGEPALVQCETEIKYDWQQGSPHELLPADDFSVRWSGSFLFEDAVYQFLIITDDGSRIFVDDVNILNAWFNQPSNMYFVNVPMTAGTHTIGIEYYEHTVFASFTARWLKL